MNLEQRLERDYDNIVKYIIVRDMCKVLMEWNYISPDEGAKFNEQISNGLVEDFLRELHHKRISLEVVTNAAIKAECHVLVEYLQGSPECRLLSLYYTLLDMFRDHLQHVGDFVDFSELLDLCRSYKCLSLGDVIELRTHLENSPVDAFDSLLTMVVRRSVTWFPDFMWILHGQGLGDIVLDIAPMLAGCESLEVMRQQCRLMANGNEEGGDPPANPPANPPVNLPENPPADPPEDPSNEMSEEDDEQLRQMDLALAQAMNLEEDFNLAARGDQGLLNAPGAGQVARQGINGALEGMGPGAAGDPIMQQELDEIRSIRMGLENEVMNEFASDIYELKLGPEQLELAAPALNGTNTLIVAPTNSGKTFVAMKIILEHLKVHSVVKTPHALFLVPKRLLVDQQLARIQQYMGGNYRCRGLTGEGQNGARIELDILYHRFHVIVLTPQILVDRLKDKSIHSLNVFSLLVFDECHNTTLEHPYNVIMKTYLEEKKHGMRNLPQIIGLTASPGAGKSFSDEHAEQHILSLCANLDIGALSWNRNLTNTAGDELQIPVLGRDVDPFNDRINRMMARIEVVLLRGIEEEVERVHARGHALGIPRPQPSDRASQAYMQWLSADLQQLHANLRYPENLDLINTASKQLKIYHKSLLLNADARSTDALAYLVEKQAVLRTIPGLQTLFQENKAYLDDVSTVDVNPDLLVLKEQILMGFRSDDDVRVMVFCKTRRLAECLGNWMAEDPDLQWFNPSYVVGQNTSEDSQAQTQYLQQQIIAKFRDGNHRIVASTPVTEEGLDIGALHLVINYKHVTNEVSRIQSKGRRRKANAKYIVIASSKTLSKDTTNQMREQLMYRALETIQEWSSAKFRAEVHRVQQEEIVAAMIKQQRRDERALSGGEYMLHCCNCNQLLTTGGQMRKVKDSLRVVIDMGFVDKVVEREVVPEPFDEFTHKAVLHCSNCREQQVGHIMRHHRLEYYQLSIESLIIESPNKARSKKRKWKKVPFDIDEINMDDKEVALHMRSFGLGEEYGVNSDASDSD